MSNILEKLSHTQVTGLVVLLVLTPFLVLSIRNLLLSRTSMHWPKASGKITKIWDFGAEIKFKLTYEYTVDRTIYKNSKIIFSTSSTYHKHLAREFEKAYVENQQVDVYYNPEKPKQAVLETGRNDGAVFGIIMFSALMLLGGLALFNQDLFYLFINQLMQLFN